MRQRDHFRVDALAHIEEARQMRAEGHAEIGLWHTHPLAKFDHPSPADVKYFARMRRQLQVPQYLGLLVFPGDAARRWEQPEAVGWIVRDTALGDVCERSEVVT
jgi:hypothetical protein